jgi:cytochrome c553
MRHTLIVTASLFAAAPVLLHSGPVQAAGDKEAGRVTAYTCTGCHGIDGYSNIYPTYKVPKVGGQNYEYLVASLKAYRNGERDHPTMELQASSLTDREIENIAAYFASIGKD